MLVSEISSITALGSVWWSAIYSSYVQRRSAQNGNVYSWRRNQSRHEFLCAWWHFSDLQEERVYICDGFNFCFSNKSKLKGRALGGNPEMKACADSLSSYLISYDLRDTHHVWTIWVGSWCLIFVYGGNDSLDSLVRNRISNQLQIFLALMNPNFSS